MPAESGCPHPASSSSLHTALPDRLVTWSVGSLTASNVSLESIHREATHTSNIQRSPQHALRFLISPTLIERYPKVELFPTSFFLCFQLSSFLQTCMMWYVCVVLLNQTRCSNTLLLGRTRRCCTTQTPRISHTFAICSFILSLYCCAAGDMASGSLAPMMDATTSSLSTSGSSSKAANAITSQD